MAEPLDAASLALLDESLERYTRTTYTFEYRRRWLGSSPGYSVDAWRDYANLGWLTLPLDEARGGFGDDPRVTNTLMARLGSALVLEPVFAHAVLCGRVLSRCDDPLAAEALDAIAAGDRILALAHGESVDEGVFGAITTSAARDRLRGRKTLVLHGDVADRLLVTARASESVRLFLLDARAAGVSIERYPLVDGRGAATLTLQDAEGTPVGPRDAASIIDAALDDARLALAAETWGIVRALNATTLQHLQTRQQFGRPIGANQTLQHRAADLYIGEVELRAVIEAAERDFSAPAPRRRRAVAAAAAVAAAVGRSTAHEAVQLHGGMGMTTDAIVSHYFKRLMVNARILGDHERMLARFAAQFPER